MATYPRAIDISATVADLKSLSRTGWPDMLASLFGDMAGRAQTVERASTRATYDLKTDWILRGIQAVPVTPAQQKAASKALRAHGDMMAAVYLRGSPDPRKSLAFMVDHETGQKRTPKTGRTIAAPQEGVEAKSRTARGRTRKRWLPGELLKRFREAGSVYAKGTTITRAFPSRKAPGKGRAVGAPFIIAAKGGTPMIVRRRGKGRARGNLEFIYALAKDQKIAKTFKFFETVYSAAAAYYRAQAGRRRPAFKAQRAA